MSGTRSNIVPITQETAEDFLPAELCKKDGIDLAALADKARAAMDGSEKSLKAAGDIADGGWLARVWQSGAFAKSVVESVGYIRDISQVNLALSAVCNDLAAANLKHAKKIDLNHRATNEQLQEVQRSMGELLQYLRAQRESALLQPIAQRLCQVAVADKQALQDWLLSFSEAIDRQYLAVQEKFDQLAQAPTVTQYELEPIREELGELNGADKKLQEHLASIGSELKRLEADVKNLDAENARQMALFGAEITHQKDLAALRIKTLEATLRQSHVKLGEGLSLIGDRISDTKRRLEAESKAREEHDVSLNEALAQSDKALRRTIQELDLRWRKRFLWGGGVLLLLQVIAYAISAS